MKNMVDIDVIIDDSYTDPKVAIYTKSRTRQVENIISAVQDTTMTGSSSCHSAI